ncbi:MAG: M50 family metallopeptidase [Muribaculaceae bacterium]|nr:M50 family metallopeptidase [Muribaculaceae bacterium]
MKIASLLAKMLIGLIIGIVIGLTIAGIAIVCFTEQTFSEYVESICSANFSDAMLSAAISIITFIISLFILTLIHEFGHLICGLISGYKFVSFRIFNYTFISIDNHIRIKRYSVEGTSGQCLLTPPDQPIDKIPVILYNAGGLIANIIVLLIAIPLFWLNASAVFKECLTIFVLTDALIILLNGVPMKITGVGNDGYNMIFLKKNMLSKQGFVSQLRANAKIQEGIRPKYLSKEWFTTHDHIDYRNAMEVSLPSMSAAILLDEMRFEEALEKYNELYSHKNEMIALYVKEIACELIFLNLVCGNHEKATELLTNDIERYLKAYRKVMSSKERQLCAIALIKDNDRAKAQAIYDNLLARENQYLLQGEVKSDLALMKLILE